MSDSVNHPKHYTTHPSGVECIQVTEHMGFCLGNAIKYVWRADSKGNAVEDLRKAAWYLRREIAKREQVGSDRDKLIAYTRELRAVPLPKFSDGWLQGQAENLVELLDVEATELLQHATRHINGT
jgi:hypothetical protein